LAVNEKTSISLEIEKYYNSCPEITYMEAMNKWLDDNDVELSEANHCIVEALRQKIHTEAVNLNMMKVDSTRTFSLDSIM
jgi:hypothetical protein